MPADDSNSNAPLIESRADLVAHLAGGEKPKDAWRIGTEHEKTPFYVRDLSPVPYGGPSGIRALLEAFQAKFGWTPIEDNDRIVGLLDPSAPMGGSITLEPGGQFELSGAPLRTLFQTCDEVNGHLAAVREVADPLGISFLGLGFSPLWTLAETPRMPKNRYAIMSGYMPKVGKLGLDMMFRSCTVQVNLDFSSEADMVKKLRVSLALQPVATALFANSPFTEGKLNGYKTFRSAIWLDTDAARTGMMPFAFEDGMGYERFVDYALDVPMYFVKRGKRHLNVAGASFRDFMDGKLELIPGEKPTIDDWADHLTTIFPEVRLKRYLEMRGADSGPWRSLCALPAFWTGLFYDQSSLDAAYDLIKDWTHEERDAIRRDVAVRALATPFRGGTLRDVARQAVELAASGLKARGYNNLVSGDESTFLDSPREAVESGHSPADILISRYNEVWGGDVRPVFAENAY